MALIFLCSSPVMGLGGSGSGSLPAPSPTCGGTGNGKYGGRFNVSPLASGGRWTSRLP